LKLVLISKTSDAGLINKVVLAVEYAPTGSDPKPRMADIRLSSNLVVALDSADKGQALTDSGKDLYIDPLTNKSWKKRADGSYQFLIHSLSNANYISTGRLFTLTLSMNLKGPLYFRLTKREQTFAPADADSLLQGTPYDGSVVVLP
jgi:hypothetical protein